MKDEIQKEPWDEDGTALSETPPPRSGWLGRIVKIFLCLLVLSAGIAGASYINKTSPKPRKRPPQKTAPLVLTQSVQPSTERITVYAMGTVIPARRIVLKARVSGEIISIHPEFTEGGFLKKGDKVLRIDPEDYRLAIAQKKSQVADAEYALKLELGRQDVAKREFRGHRSNLVGGLRSVDVCLEPAFFATVLQLPNGLSTRQSTIWSSQPSRNLDARTPHLRVGNDDAVAGGYLVVSQ